MIVVADTSPLNYLILIGRVDVLPKLFKRVAIPRAVERELRSRFAPTMVRSWVQDAPSWLEVRDIDGAAIVAKGLHAGEGEAITLAQQIKADTLLMDELRGRVVAMNAGSK